MDKIDQVIYVTGVTFDKEEMRIPVSENILGRLTVAIQPSDATIKGINWTSSDTSVATIYGTLNGSDGSKGAYIPGLSSGTSIITATTLDGSYAASCTVTVYEPVVEGDFVFDPGTGTIVEYTGTQATLEIPETISGIPVQAIGYEAFYGIDYIASVTLPSSITKIEERAFYSCSNLYVIDIGSGVQTADDSVYYGNYIRDAYEVDVAGIYERQENSITWTKR